jgi:hypothetical protein
MSGQLQAPIQTTPVFPGQIPYETEWLHNKAALRSIESLPGHVQDILNSGLSYSCKNILINRALTMFSNVVVLANLTPTKQVSGLFGMIVQQTGYTDTHAEVDFELLMLEDRAGYRRSDLSNPNLLRLENAQMLIFKFVLTRTKGVNREGIEQHHMTQRTEQSFSGINPMNPNQNLNPPQERKKLFGIL